MALRDLSVGSTPESSSLQQDHSTSPRFLQPSTYECSVNNSPFIQPQTFSQLFGSSGCVVKSQVDNISTSLRPRPSPPVFTRSRSSVREGGHFSGAGDRSSGRQSRSATPGLGAAPLRDRLRPLAMEGLVQDFNMALDETAGSHSSERSTSRRKAWKRRCKSTSNLVTAGQNISEDSSSSLDNVGLLSRDRGTSSLQLSDSDPEQGGVAGTATAAPPACNTRRSKMGASSKTHDIQRRRVVLDPFTIESDSFTENISPYKEFRVHNKRKRKSKRMAVDQSSENIKPVLQSGFVFRSPGQGTKRKKVRSRSGCDGFLTGKKTGSGIIPGKRKRSAREKSVDSHLNDKIKDKEDRMECDDISISSLSSSEWEDLASDLSNGDNGEADDEQSDWPGPEPGAMSVMHLTDEEIDTEVTFNVNTSRKGTLTRRSFIAREIKAGARRLRTQRTIPTVEGGRKLTLPEIVTRFIQDATMNSLCIPLPVRSHSSTEDRGTVLRLASLYSLSWTQEEPNSIVISKNVHLSEPSEFVVPGIPRNKDQKKFDPKRQKKLVPPQSPVSRMESISGRSLADSSSNTRNRRKSGSKSS